MFLRYNIDASVPMVHDEILFPLLSSTSC
uniref:Uncharacterized protein n=1 Tax=Arundo donax TaxID=35708 RepID=A0A0A9B6I0_ARUDO